MDAGKKTIGDIFNRTRILEIPFFQRSYVWGSEQWERMLDDMENVCSTNKPYFLGSVILKQQPTSTNYKVGDVRTVIDGQQRLTTLCILFKVLCLKINQNQLFEGTFKTISGDITLQHNHNDVDSFTKILSLNQLDEIKEDNKIVAAYNFLVGKLNPDKVDFYKILSNALFVGIDLGENEDEQQIFDTINSLGVTLTTAELLKNYFFNRDINSYNKFWKYIFEKDEETKNYWDKEITAGRLKRTFIDLFFFSFLQIKIQDKSLNVKTEDKIEFSRVERLFESYKKFIKNYLNNEKAGILSEIKEYAKLFGENFDIEITDRELTANAGIERINAIIFGLDNSTLIPYVLYILKNVSDDGVKNRLFEYLETYIMRRMVVHANTKNYNQLFTDRLILNEILSVEQLSEHIEKLSDKINYMPTDEELWEKGFNSAILINKQSTGILYLIETKIRKSSLHSTQLLGLNKYSLEHIMPKKWENNWGIIKDENEKRNRDRKLLTLGNLTIITQPLNSKIRDANWNDKKEKGLKSFSADLETLNQYLSLTEWNEITIGLRAENLYEKAKTIWKVS
jgi:uncharacterized protein with ParB-like and HNH nuclease domain